MSSNPHSRPARLAVAILAALGLSAAAPVSMAKGPAADRPAAATSALERTTYIVLFDDEPLANYRGPKTDRSVAGARGLAATSPSVTGAARLDVNAAASRAYLDYLKERRDSHLAAVEARISRKLAPTQVYDVVLNGVAVTLDAAEAAEAAGLPGIRKVVPDWVARPQTDAGPPWIGAPIVWNGSVGLQSRGEGVVVGVIDTGIIAGHLSFSATSGGVPITNPRGGFLGLCTTGQATCNGKLIGIYDFTTGAEDQEPNNGSDMDGHGSHVASTAVGNPLQADLSGTTRDLSGVAPRANLIMYKACEGVSDCQETWLLGALDQAVADGVDVINYSIGGEARDPWESGSDAEAMRNARAAGVVVVVAAGNDGPGESTVSAPGNAPWVLTAAAATHTRSIGTEVQFRGGDSPLPGGGSLIGASNTGNTGNFFPLVKADPSLCAEGEDTALDGNNFPAGWISTTFANRVVVCERGTYARVDKSRNAGQAGGRGMLLLNQLSDGVGTVADTHSIPASHLGFPDAQQVRDWLARGSGHEARINGVTLRDVPGAADVLASFSGRGPNPGGSVDVSGVLKPDVTAPGVDVLAAGCPEPPTPCTDAEANTTLAFLSGTSMATPHVSGAAALILGATRNAGKSPAWKADQVISALTATARASGRLEDGVTAASPFDQGHGVVDLAQAVRAGLYFPSNATGFPSFAGGNPGIGGRPRDLNLPSLTHETCFTQCSLSRRVMDMRGGGSWQVEIEAPDDLAVTASPNQFTLAAGGAQTLSFDIQIANFSHAGTWRFGKVRLRNLNNNGTPDTVLPLSVFVDPGNTPSRIDLNVDGDAGWVDQSLSGLVPLASARYAGTALVPVTPTQATLPVDPSNDDPYDSDTGVRRILVTVPQSSDGQPARWRLRASTDSPTANDIDLFVGEDFNGDGLASEDEELCRSTSVDASEDCDVEIVHPGSGGALQYWILAQNWANGLTQDVVDIEHALVPMAAENRSLTATGPGHTPSQASFTLRLGWDDPTFLAGEKRIGFLLLSPSPDVVMAEVPVTLTRTSATPVARALRHGQPQTVRLNAGESHERLFFDVPVNAAAVSFTLTNAAGYDLYLAKAGTLDPAQAGIAVAPPRAQAVRNAVGSAATKTLSLSGAELMPGRWYATPVRNGSASGAPSAALTARIDSQGAPPSRRLAHYFNPSRSGHGLIMDPAGNGGVWIAVWYSYLQDGTPTWYFLQAAAPGPNDGFWTAPILRVVWDGGATSLVEVGQASLSFQGLNAQNLETLTFSYTLDGATGSEPMQRLVAAGGCPVVSGQNLDVTGHWFSPSQSGFGYSVQAEPNLEFIAAYLYDGLGFPRWLVGQANAFQAGSGTLPMSQFIGGPFPGGGASPPTPQAVGQFARTYSGGTLASVDLSATLAAPLSGAWQRSLPIGRLSDPKNCQ